MEGSRRREEERLPMVRESEDDGVGRGKSLAGKGFAGPSIHRIPRIIRLAPAFIRPDVVTRRLGERSPSSSSELGKTYAAALSGGSRSRLSLSSLSSILTACLEKWIPSFSIQGAEASPGHKGSIYILVESCGSWQADVDLQARVVPEFLDQPHQYHVIRFFHLQIESSRPQNIKWPNTFSN